MAKIRLRTTPGTPNQMSTMKSQLPKQAKTSTPAQTDSFNEYSESHQIKLNTTPASPESQSSKSDENSKSFKKPIKKKKRTKKVFYCQSLPAKSAIKKSNTGLRLLKSVCESLTNAEAV